ncbi:PREDICTED: FGFR1 oncogene partner-like, partial [Priapulus caudatus]|uniref:FGFR1 oncogene partner-like n=1 Tax=Priapulus caudatus TaxID=37621 RepID=A0ABM1EX73_PRICU
AQLRASVFLALEEQERVENRTPFMNKPLVEYLSSKDGQTVVSLVREFLVFFNLDCTLSVFDPECGASQCNMRDELATLLGFKDVDLLPRSPLLAEVFRRHQKVAPPDGANSHCSRLSNGTLVRLSLQGWWLCTSQSLSIEKDPKGGGSASESNSISDEMSGRSSHSGKSHSKGENSASKSEGSRRSKHGDDVRSDKSASQRSRRSARERSSQPHGSDRATESGGERREEEEAGSGAERKAFDHALSSSMDGSRDPFFDEPSSPVKAKPPAGSKEKSDAQKKKKKTDSSHSSLGDLPPLGKAPPSDPTDDPNPKKATEERDWKELEKINKRIKELGFELPDDQNYDEDFSPSSSSSAASSTSTGVSVSKSSKSSHRSKTSERSKAPKKFAAASEANPNKPDTQSQIEEEIEEEIEEDLEIEDILNSDIGLDDITTDHTISQVDGIGNIDYMEDILEPLSP